MSVEVYKGIITDAGATFTAPEVNLLTIFTYLEFDNETMVKMVAMGGALENKVISALKAGEPVELHLKYNPSAKNAKYGLLAFKRSNGRLYALDAPAPSLLTKLLPIVLFGLGIPTIPMAGMGLVLWYFAWKAFQSAKQTQEAYNYVHSLNADAYII